MNGGKGLDVVGTENKYVVIFFDETKLNVVTGTAGLPGDSD